jgi:transcription-repair coupling factor (superfamily II helicase)
MLSRFRSEREQREIVQRLKDGGIDILIGTHRLLGKDVEFKNLGLVIIDEEQRFGVAHKERLKQMRAEVDVLAMSATPIPRTLHMSLAGVRDMSSIETAPEARLPIKTYVMEWEDHLLREAILRELDRGGQVYFVHNRVHNIASVAYKVAQLVPEAEVRVGHGQMPEEELERVMLEFARGDADVLVCTTIIESGLDIPNVNTIVMNQANTLGLSQLYQLRGRVGRGTHQAYAYLLYDKSRALSEAAQKRLQAVFEATELGAGFQLALRDLEIRGAGNLLGSEQSGYIAAVGFDLYNQMLADAVEKLKRAWKPEEATVQRRTLPSVDLPITAHVPETYVPDLNVRLAVYERISQIDSLEGLAAYAAELQDRFGPVPPALSSLLLQTRLRILAADAGLQSISTEEERTVVLRFPDAGGTPAQAWRHLASRTIDVRRTQLRLDLQLAGEGWTRVLEDLLTQLASDGGARVSARPTLAEPPPPRPDEDEPARAVPVGATAEAAGEVRLPRKYKWTERRHTR